MHYVSLIIEFLRGRPAVVFWTVALTQAALWTLMPALFYSAPPGDVPLLLAIGHEFVLGSYLGPPLAFWLGEVAYRLGGAFGLYALAQACIVVTYWAVFTLGRRIVGTRHAVLAVLLMVGIAAFTVPSPDFGPAVLAAPLWALALLHYWRAVGEGERGYWFLLALDLGLLLLASYVGLILIALLLVFALVSPRGRAALLNPEPWIALLPFVIVIFPHLAWLKGARDLVVSGLNDSAAAAGTLSPGVWLCIALVVTHLGLGLLVAFASGWPRRRRERAPLIDRNPVEPLARLFVYFFALMPAACGDRHRLRQRPAWPARPRRPAGGSVRPCGGGRRRRSSAALSRADGVVDLARSAGGAAGPHRARHRAAAVDLRRSTCRCRSRPIPRAASSPIVSSAAPASRSATSPAMRKSRRWSRSPAPAGRMSISTGRRSAARGRAPPISAEHGGMLVWPARDNTGAPPAALKAQFPAMVPEVQRSFARSIQGLLPLIRVGWATVRPQAP